MAGGGALVAPRQVDLGHSGCLIVSPTGGDYDLTDDVAIQVKTRKGGREITELTLTGQDVIGPDGIAHESETIDFETPVPTDPNGFVLHIHADQVPVYRLSGHLNGKRVEQIGTIAIGDVVYRPE